MDKDLEKTFKRTKLSIEDLIKSYDKTVLNLKILSIFLFVSHMPLFFFFMISIGTGHYDPKYINYFIFAIAGTITASIIAFIKFKIDEKIN